jgi:hypothetical protein
MTEFTSDIKTIPYSQENIYKVLSDLSNLEHLKDKIPQDQVSDFSFDSDSCSFSVHPVGKIKFSVVDREPFQTIKFAADQSPIDVSLWIQLKGTGESETKMKLTVKAQLNPFLKPMIAKPLQNGINKIADILANVSY